MSEPLDLDAIKARLAAGWDVPGQIFEDIAALLAEVERLRADLALAKDVIAHHVAERGLVEHDGLLVTPEEKDLLDG